MEKEFVQLIDQDMGFRIVVRCQERLIFITEVLGFKQLKKKKNHFIVLFCVLEAQAEMEYVGESGPFVLIGHSQGGMIV